MERQHFYNETIAQQQHNRSGLVDSQPRYSHHRPTEATSVSPPSPTDDSNNSTTAPQRQHMITVTTSSASAPPLSSISIPRGSSAQQLTVPPPMPSHGIDLQYVPTPSPFLPSATTALLKRHNNNSNNNNSSSHGGGSAATPSRFSGGNRAAKEEEGGISFSAVKYSPPLSASASSPSPSSPASRVEEADGHHALGTRRLSNNRIEPQSAITTTTAREHQPVKVTMPIPPNANSNSGGGKEGGGCGSDHETDTSSGERHVTSYTTTTNTTRLIPMTPSSIAAYNILARHHRSSSSRQHSPSSANIRNDNNNHNKTDNSNANQRLGGEVFDHHYYQQQPHLSSPTSSSTAPSPRAQSPIGQQPLIVDREGHHQQTASQLSTSIPAAPTSTTVVKLISSSSPSPSAGHGEKALTCAIVAAPSSLHSSLSPSVPLPSSSSASALARHNNDQHEIHLAKHLLLDNAAQNLLREGGKRNKNNDNNHHHHRHQNLGNGATSPRPVTIHPVDCDASTAPASRANSTDSANNNAAPITTSTATTVVMSTTQTTVSLALPMLTSSPLWGNSSSNRGRDAADARDACGAVGTPASPRQPSFFSSSSAKNTPRSGYSDGVGTVTTVYPNNNNNNNQRSAQDVAATEEGEGERLLHQHGRGEEGQHQHQQPSTAPTAHQHGISIPSLRQSGIPVIIRHHQQQSTAEGKTGGSTSAAATTPLNTPRVTTSTSSPLVVATATTTPAVVMGTGSSNTLTTPRLNPMLASMRAAVKPIAAAAAAATTSSMPAAHQSDHNHRSGGMITTNTMTSGASVVPSSSGLGAGSSRFTPDFTLVGGGNPPLMAGMTRSQILRQRHGIALRQEMEGSTPLPFSATTQATQPQEGAVPGHRPTSQHHLFDYSSVSATGNMPSGISSVTDYSPIRPHTSYAQNSSAFVHDDYGGVSSISNYSPPQSPSRGTALNADALMMGSNGVGGDIIVSPITPPLSTAHRHTAVDIGSNANGALAMGISTTSSSHMTLNGGTKGPRQGQWPLPHLDTDAAAAINSYLQWEDPVGRSATGRHSSSSSYLNARRMPSTHGQSSQYLHVSDAISPKGELHYARLRHGKQYQHQLTRAATEDDTGRFQSLCTYADEESGSAADGQHATGGDLPPSFNVDDEIRRREQLKAEEMARALEALRQEYLDDLEARETHHARVLQAEVETGIQQLISIDEPARRRDIMQQWQYAIPFLHTHGECIRLFQYVERCGRVTAYLQLSQRHWDREVSKALYQQVITEGIDVVEGLGERGNDGSAIRGTTANRTLLTQKLRTMLTNFKRKKRSGNEMETAILDPKLTTEHDDGDDGSEFSVIEAAAGDQTPSGRSPLRTGGAGTPLRSSERLKMEPNDESMLMAKSPARVKFDEFRRTFSLHKAVVPAPSPSIGIASPPPVTKSSDAAPALAGATLRSFSAVSTNSATAAIEYLYAERDETFDHNERDQAAKSALKHVKTLGGEGAQNGGRGTQHPTYSATPSSLKEPSRQIFESAVMRLYRRFLRPQSTGREEGEKCPGDNKNNSSASPTRALNLEFSNIAAAAPLNTFPIPVSPPLSSNRAFHRTTQLSCVDESSENLSEYVNLLSNIVADVTKSIVDSVDSQWHHGEEREGAACRQESSCLSMAVEEDKIKKEGKPLQLASFYDLQFWERLPPYPKALQAELNNNPHAMGKEHPPSKDAHHPYALPFPAAETLDRLCLAYAHYHNADMATLKAIVPILASSLQELLFVQMEALPALGDEIKRLEYIRSQEREWIAANATRTVLEAAQSEFEGAIETIRCHFEERIAKNAADDQDAKLQQLSRASLEMIKDLQRVSNERDRAIEISGELERLLLEKERMSKKSEDVLNEKNEELMDEYWKLHTQLESVLSKCHASDEAAVEDALSKQLAENNRLVEELKNRTAALDEICATKSVSEDEMRCNFEKERERLIKELQNANALAADLRSQLESRGSEMSAQQRLHDQTARQLMGEIASRSFKALYAHETNEVFMRRALGKEEEQAFTIILLKKQQHQLLLASSSQQDKATREQANMCRNLSDRLAEAEHAFDNTKHELLDEIDACEKENRRLREIIEAQNERIRKISVEETAEKELQDEEIHNLGTKLGGLKMENEQLQVKLEQLAREREEERRSRLERDDIDALNRQIEQLREKLHNNPQAVKETPVVRRPTNAAQQRAEELKSVDCISPHSGATTTTTLEREETSSRQSISLTRSYEMILLLLESSEETFMNHHGCLISILEDVFPIALKQRTRLDFVVKELESEKEMKTSLEKAYNHERKENALKRRLILKECRRWKYTAKELQEKLDLI